MSVQAKRFAAAGHRGAVQQLPRNHLDLDRHVGISGITALEYTGIRALCLCFLEGGLRGPLTCGDICFEVV